MSWDLQLLCQNTTGFAQNIRVATPKPTPYISYFMKWEYIRTNVAFKTAWMQWDAHGVTLFENLTSTKYGPREHVTMLMNHSPEIALPTFD